MHVPRPSFGATDVARAVSANVDDVLTMTSEYRNGDKLTGAVVSSELKTKTYFKGDKGDEVADYSTNFKKGATDIGYGLRVGAGASRDTRDARAHSLTQ